MTNQSDFQIECFQEIEAQFANDKFRSITNEWISLSNKMKYSYHFSWLGRPIIQYPPDIVAVQEIIWHTRPDLIIETGIAHGGSLILSASILALLEYSDATQRGLLLDPANPKRKVLGIDIDIRPHNRKAIEEHPLSSRIEMIEGSSISTDVVQKVSKRATNSSNILILLDSNHTYDHVLAELHAYTPLVSLGSYCIVFDTIIDKFPGDAFSDRPWGKNNNPKTAVTEFLKKHSEYQIDKQIEKKLMITVAPDGFLKRIR